MSHYTVHLHIALVKLWNQWERSVASYGGQGQSGQAIKLFQAP